MTLVSSFGELVRQVSSAMTAPTFASFTIVLTDWVFARRRTVTNMNLAANAVASSTTPRFTGFSPRRNGRWTNWDWPSSV